MEKAMTKLQDHIDSCGRLAAFITEQVGDATPEDVMAWAAEANILMQHDTKIAALLPP